MKKLSAIWLVLMMLCLHAQPAVQPKETVAERWEIVTDIFIGVQTEMLSAEERLSYGSVLPPHQGLRIKKIMAESPAQTAGLRVGDVILKNNGARIASMEDLLLSVRNTRPGELIHLDILRDGKKYPVRLRVGALPEPVVVAYATLTERSTPNPNSIAENQRRIAHLLAEEHPNVTAIYDEFKKINNLFPSLARPGQIRLYYETAIGTATVTAYPSKITVTAELGQEVMIYHLQHQGNTLPQYVREMFK